jgi:hypothetical protein
MSKSSYGFSYRFIHIPLYDICIFRFLVVPGKEGKACLPKKNSGKAGI